jgi:glutathione S-transferase
VLVALELKGLPYEIDPIVPFMGDERFSRLSPLRRIPVYSDERVTLTDSSVICQYLEDTHPEPALYPLDVAERAQARWLEEYADTRLADVLIWGLFNETMIAPAVWGRAPDPHKIARVRDVELPPELAWLEAHGHRRAPALSAVREVAPCRGNTRYANTVYARMAAGPPPRRSGSRAATRARSRPARS